MTPAAEVPAARPRLAVRGDGVLKVETCTGTWLFDLRRSRFCRVPVGTDPTFLPPEAWSPYARLVLSPQGLVRVMLDPTADPGARTGITGWVHGPQCRRCLPHPVGEDESATVGGDVSLGEVAGAVAAVVVGVEGADVPVGVAVGAAV